VSLPSDRPTDGRLYGGIGTTASEELVALGGLGDPLGSGTTAVSSVHECGSCSGGGTLCKCAVVSNGAIISCGLLYESRAADVPIMHLTSKYTVLTCSTSRLQQRVVFARSAIKEPYEPPIFNVS
jgi:hypothetical protein